MMGLLYKLQIDFFFFFFLGGGGVLKTMLPGVEGGERLKGTYIHP